MNQLFNHLAMNVLRRCLHTWMKRQSTIETQSGWTSSKEGKGGVPSQDRDRRWYESLPIYLYHTESWSIRKINLILIEAWLWPGWSIFPTELGGMSGRWWFLLWIMYGISNLKVTLNNKFWGLCLTWPPIDLFCFSLYQAVLVVDCEMKKVSWSKLTGELYTILIRFQIHTSIDDTNCFEEFVSISWFHSYRIKRNELFIVWSNQ